MFPALETAALPPIGDMVRVAPRPRLLLTLLCSSQFFNIVNISSVNIALPDIAVDLRFNESTLAWVVSAYLLTFAGFLLIGGRIADLVGHGIVLIAGLVVFGVFTLACALAPTPTMLIAGRGFQGVGAALTIPASLGILAQSFTGKEERSRAVAAFGAAGAVGFAAGLVLGGATAGTLGWRWIFGLSVPAVAVLLVLAFAVIKPRLPERRDGCVDLAGAVTSTAGLLAIVYGLSNSGHSGWTDPTTILSSLGGVGLAAFFVYLQTRVRSPLMPLRLWRRPNFAAAMVMGFCIFAAWIGGNYFLALTLQRVLGYGPAEAATALLPLAFAGLVGATAAGRLLPRSGPRPFLITGFGSSIASFVLMAQLDAHSSYLLQVMPAMILSVVGHSLNYVACSLIVLAGAPAGDQGVVGGLFNTCMQVGGGLGLGVMSAIAATQLSPNAADGGLVNSYQAAFWVAAGFAALGLVTTVRFVREASLEDEAADVEDRALRR